MVQEQVRLPDHCEDVLAVLARQAWRDSGRMRRASQLCEARDIDDFREVPEVEQSLDLVNLIRSDLQGVDELITHPLAHALRDLEPHHLAKAASSKLFLH